MERLVKGIWIPLEIWTASRISWNEKILLMEIDSFSSKGKPCFISNEFIGKMFNVSEQTASKYINNLIKQGYVIVEKFDGRSRYVRSILSDEFKSDLKETLRQTPQELDATYNKNTNKSSINIEDNRERKGFVPPTLEQVRDYCLARQNGIDPEEFIAHYTSNGWMVGKVKMKDWKMSIITWEKHRRKERKVPLKERKESTFEKSLREIDKMFGTNMHEQNYGRDDNNQ